MTKILHLITHQPDPLAQSLIERQRASGSSTIRVWDLTSTEHQAVDYAALVDALFEADHVDVW